MGRRVSNTNEILDSITIDQWSTLCWLAQDRISDCKWWEFSCKRYWRRLEETAKDRLSD